MTGYLATCLFQLALPAQMRGSGALSWPYPILQPLKPLFAALGPLEIPVAQALGLVGVYLLSGYLEFRLDALGRNPLACWAVGVSSWPLFLLVVNGLIYMSGLHLPSVG